MPFTVIYEDDAIIVVNKSCGIPVIKERGKMPLQPLKERLEAYCTHRLYTVHRIDKETSGIVVFAKDTQAHKQLCLQFEQRSVKKWYIAVVMGSIEASGCIKAPLYQFGSGRMGVKEGGKYSETAYQRKSLSHNVSLITVIPLTGRRHQIRVHLYHIGHPILGDLLYGEERPVAGVSRLMLHASRLELHHPNGEKYSFYAEVSQGWADVAASYGLAQIHRE